MKPYKFILIIFAFAAVYISCKKDEGAVTDNIIGTWKASDSYIVTFDTITNKDTVVNTFQTRKECEKDDMLRIQDDKKIFALNGTLLCDTEQTEQSLGAWGLLSKNKVLRILSDDLADTTDYNLLFIDKTTLKLSIENDTILNSVRYYTYTKN